VSELLNCPICGAKAKFKNVQDGLIWWVSCDGDCMCEIGTERSKDAALEVWNTRAKNPVVARLHDPEVLRGIIYRNAMQRLSADDGNAPMYITAQDIRDGIQIVTEMRKDGGK